MIPIMFIKECNLVKYCREWIILSLVLCEPRKPCKIIVWQLSGGNWELKKHRAIIVRRLLESTSWSIYQQLDLPDRYCPDIVQILSGYCPDIVRILSGRSNITKLQRGQNWTYIQRLTISRPPMGTVFRALSFSHGPRPFFGSEITIKLSQTVQQIKLAN